MDEVTQRVERKGSLLFALKIGAALLFGVCFAVVWYGTLAWGATWAMLKLSKAIFG